MIAGDASEWDGFVTTGGVASILALALDAWANIASVDEDELEEHVSIRLYSRMVNAQDRQAHRFLIRYEDVEVDTDLAKETGRKDIVFFPCHDGTIYYCLEAKRLNVRVSGIMKSLADEYVKEGMQRFVTGKYSRHVQHGGMIGYVLDGDVERAMKNVLNNIRQHHADLGMAPPGEWQECVHRPGDSQTRESQHQRVRPAKAISIQHLFVKAVLSRGLKRRSVQAGVRNPSTRKTK